MTKLLNNADVTGYISQTSVTSSLLKTDSAGKLVAATAGTDYQSPTTALLPTGGTAGQILSKIDATNYNTQWIDNFATQLKHEVKLGATLAKGKAVYVSSADGTNMIVSAASNGSDATSSKTLGLLETGGATNDIVKVVTEGLLAGLDTSTATIGDPVWLGTSGNLLFGTANKPVAPAHMVFIGIVTRVQSNNGEIFVKVQNGFELEELHNVSAVSPSNNDGIFYNTSTSLWEKKSIATVLGFTPANGANYLPLAGGTMTGAIVGTTATFTNSGSGIGLGLTLSGASGDGIKITHSAGRAFNISSSGTGYGILINNLTGSSSAPFTIQNQGASKVTFTAAGAGEFGSTITASQFIKTGGTDAQILAADGSVITAGTGIAISGGTIAATGGASSSARNEQTFTATAGTNNLTITGGYTVGLIDVYVNGVKYPPSDYTATTSPTVTITGLVAGDIVSTIAYTSTISLLPTSRDVFEYTATSGQVDFTVSGGYTIGLLDVYVNGTKLTSSEYSMPDTTKFTLTIASVAGNQVQAIRYNSSVTGVSGSGTTNYVPKFTATGTIGSSLISTTSTGATTFTSNQNATTTFTFQNTNTTDASTRSYINLAAGTSYLTLKSLHGDHSYIDSSANLYLQSGNAVKMTILSSGNVGVGTTSPVTAGGSYLGLNISNSTGASLVLTSNTSHTYLYAVNGSNDFFIENAGAQVFRAGSAERMRITSGGDLALGDTSAFGYKVRFKNAASSPYGISMVYTGSPNVTGDNQFIICADGTNDKFIVWSSGSVVNRTGSYGTISDIKFKENVVDATPKLADLMNLKVRNFNLKGESTKQIGFIAQEFEEVFPNMVDINKNKDVDGETYKSIKTSVLVPMLVKAIQELKAELDALKNN